MFEQSNPKNVDTSKPFIYLIKITTGQNSFKYIGKASSKSRLKEYQSNITKILSGKPRRPELKQNGEPQSSNNLKYRFIHLALALAVKNNWLIEHYPYENTDKESQNERERELIVELSCNLNNREQWHINDFERMESKFINEFEITI